MTIKQTEKHRHSFGQSDMLFDDGTTKVVWVCSCMMVLESNLTPYSEVV